MGSISSVVTVGFFGGPLVTLGLGSSEVTATLVGQWSNVVHLKTEQSRITLTATNEKTRMEATDANNH